MKSVVKPDQRGTFSRLVRECMRFPTLLVMIFISLGCLGGGQLYLTWIAKKWTDGPLLTGDRFAMAQLGTRAGELAIVMMAGLFFSRYLLNLVNQLMLMRLRDRAQRRLMEVEIRALRAYPSGELISRFLNDAGQLSTFVREILRRLIGESIVLVGAITMLFYLNWRLALLTIVMVPLVGAALGRIGKVIRALSAQAQKDVGHLSATLNEQLHGVSTIKGLLAETHEEQRFARQNDRYRRRVMHSELWAATLSTSVWLITALGLLAVVWYGTSQVASKAVTSGALLAFVLYAVQTVEPLRRLSEVQSLLQQSLAAGSRVFELIDLSPTEREGSRGLPTPIGGEFSLERVSFRYHPDKPVLNDLSFSLRARENAALVSISGGGKSTIAALAIRLRDPDTGSILIDGIRIADLRLSDLRGCVAVAEQEAFVFTGTLRDNICYGSWNAEEASIHAAVELAGLESVVASVPGGLNGVLIEAGHNLSGGQKQRIALARMIVRDPAILILDEATSALDSDTESLIFNQLADWMARRTVLLMAHRLSTISRFPRVIVLDAGRVVGDGRVTDLLETCPPFSRIFAEQIAPVSASGQPARAAS